MSNLTVNKKILVDNSYETNESFQPAKMKRFRIPHTREVKSQLRRNKYTSIVTGQPAEKMRMKQ